LRLSPKIRDGRASYSQSLRVLKKIKEFDSEIFTKSFLMMGVGETDDEVLQTAHDLLWAGVDIMTIGQHLQPTPKHMPLVKYVTPETFKCFKKNIEPMGFKYVAAGPLVRSSYKAGESFLEKMVGRNPHHHYQPNL
jgi:lipoyl synthase